MNHDEMTIGFTVLELDKLKQWAEGIAGQWNGKESGLADEIVKKVEELETLLEEIRWIQQKS
jgi:hypothetical protein